MKKFLALTVATLLLTTGASAHHSNVTKHRHVHALAYCANSVCDDFTDNSRAKRCGVPFVCVDKDGDSLCDMCGFNHHSSNVTACDNNSAKHHGSHHNTHCNR